LGAATRKHLLQAAVNIGAVLTGGERDGRHRRLRAGPQYRRRRAALQVAGAQGRQCQAGSDRA
jgi:hypothetical protein